MADHTFIDDYEYGAPFFRAVSTFEGRPDVPALCAFEPALTERVGAAMRPVLTNAAEQFADIWHRYGRALNDD